MSVHILAIGLNPAYQKTLEFDVFEKGQINRASKVTITAGGKGQHLAKASSTVLPGSATVAHFLGGSTGMFIEQELNKKSIPQLIVKTPNDTRTCTTLLCGHTNDMTELIEPSATITQEQQYELMTSICSKIPSIHAVALCGTYPPGVATSFYKQVAEQKLTHKFLLLVDAFKGISETLETGLVDILKINLTELETLMSVSPSNEDSAIHNAVSLCFAKYNIRYLAITNGKHKSFLFQNNNYKPRTGNDVPISCSVASSQASFTEFSYQIPDMGKIVNPIGAGDTVSGVLIAKLLQGQNIEDAFKFALAAGSASCLYIEGARFDIETANQIEAKIVCSI